MSNHRPDDDVADAPEISVVVPLFNEQENVRQLHQRLTEVMESLEVRYELIFVDDGSRDATGSLIDELGEADPHVVPAHLSRNFGHQAAISAGLDLARGRAVVLMDGDFQDPPELLPRMIDLWRDGAEVVYGVRRNRKEPLPLRAAYAVFYRLLRSVSELEIPLDSGDFCLMDRQVVDVLRHLPERLRFVRGLRTFVGFRQVPLEYDRPARAAGKPKYTFRALLRLAADGLVSFSGYPLQLVTYLGVFAAATAVLLTGWVVWDAFSNQYTPRGWASTVIVILFMNSILMINQGIQGAYLRRIFLEVKRRPTYILRSPGPLAAPARGDGDPLSGDAGREADAADLASGPVGSRRRP